MMRLTCHTDKLVLGTTEDNNFADGIAEILLSWTGGTVSLMADEAEDCDCEGTARISRLASFKDPPRKPHLPIKGRARSQLH